MASASQAGGYDGLPVDRTGWDGARAVVAGFGAAGFAAADNLLHVGARVTVLEEDADARPAEAELLDVLGADVRRGPGSTGVLPADTDLLVVSPGWPADAPLIARARDRGVPVWSDAELAWRLQDPAVPWLVIAGPDGDPGCDEIAGMAILVLGAAGLRTTPLDGLGPPLVELVMDPEPRDALVVVLGASQLRDVHTVAARAAVVLDAGTDPTLGRAYQGVEVACVYGVADPESERLVREADVVEGARAIGLTLGTPSVGTLGLVEDLLADRAFLAERATSAAELASLDDLAAPDGTPAAPPVVWHALAAAALTRALDVPQAAVRDGLRAWAAGAGGRFTG